MPGQKIYVITTPELIQAVQKQPKTLAFPPIEATFARNVCGPSDAGHSIVVKSLNCDEGGGGLSVELYAAMRLALKPGPDLDRMNRVMIKIISESLDQLTSSATEQIRIKLGSWLRVVVTTATTDSVYGLQNPFREQAVVDGFWYVSPYLKVTNKTGTHRLYRQFEKDLMTFVIGIMPSVMARKGLVARERVAQAFEKYYRNEGHKQASTLTRRRYEIEAKHGLSIEDIAHYEVGGAIAALVNTTPATFWMLLLINADPGLLKDIRDEVGSRMTTTTGDSGKTKILDITTLKTTCPLVTSTFQEVLRYRSMGTSVRQVMEDTVLDGRWLLQKNAMLQMPSRIFHKDASIWGSDVDDFNPRRFMKGELPKTADGKRPNPVAFRAFGGGSTLCPGRHFSTNEILAVVIMFVMRYDIVPTSGEWTLPGTEKTNVAAVMMEPDTDVEVLVCCRKGFEEDHWEINLEDSDSAFAVVAEDREP